MNLEKLNDPCVEARLAAVRGLGESVKAGVKPTDEVNNHVHTIIPLIIHLDSSSAIVRVGEARLSRPCCYGRCCLRRLPVRYSKPTIEITKYHLYVPRFSIRDAVNHPSQS